MTDYPPTSKYPEEFESPGDEDFSKIYEPRLETDSRGRTILPFTPGQKVVLDVTPGSKNVKIGSEDYNLNPIGDPSSLKTGYLYNDTTIKAGPEGGWVTEISGGSANYPLRYWNETSGEQKFSLDKEGNVSITGLIQVGGAADDVNDGTTEIQAGKVLISGSTTLDGWSSGGDATKIDGGEIYTNSITASQIAADAVSTAELNVVGIDGSTGRILVSDTTDADEVTSGINSHATTLIQGGKIVTGSITTTQLNLTPIESSGGTGDVIATINASSEGINIDAELISISGSTVFSSGYDPSEKAKTFRQNTAPSSGMSEGDVWIDIDNGDTPYTYNGSSWIQAYTIIDGGNITTGTINACIIDAGTITTGTLDASSASITNIDAGNINTGTLDACTVDADTIDVGTLSGIDVRSSSGNDRIVLDNGDYLKFYKGGALKAQLRGTTTGTGGLFVENGSDVYIENDNSFFIQDTTGSDILYGGMSIDSSNDLLLIAGTTNDIYFVKNDGTSVLANIDQSGNMELAGSLEVVKDVIPNSSPETDYYQCGTSSLYWAEVHAGTGGFIEHSNSLPKTKESYNIVNSLKNKQDGKKINKEEQHKRLKRGGGTNMSELIRSLTKVVQDMDERLSKLENNL